LFVNTHLLAEVNTPIYDDDGDEEDEEEDLRSPPSDERAFFVPETTIVQLFEVLIYSFELVLKSCLISFHYY
jgi:hypothetical protein